MQMKTTYVRSRSKAGQMRNVYIDIFQNDLRATDSSCNVATDDSITILPNGRVLCRQDRGRFTSPSGYNSLTVKFTTHHYENGGNSAGFKAVYTVFYEADASRTCQGNDYFCMYDRWCIAEYLVCDGYYHCSQGTDEYNCGKSSSDWLFTLLVLVVIFGACVLACGYKKYNHRGAVTSRRSRSRRESSDQLESPTLEFDGPASPPVPPPYSEEPPEYTEIYDPSSLGIDNPALEMSMTSLNDQNFNTYEIPDEPPPSYEFALSNSTENIVDTAEEGGETTSADNESLQQGSDNETADSGIHFVENESSSLSGDTRDNCEQPDHEDDGRPQPAANYAELSSDNITPCLPNESSSSSPEVNNEGEENSTPSKGVCEREDNSNTEYEIPVAEGNESPTTEDTRTRANILDEDTTSNRDDRDDEVSDGDGEVNTVCMFFGGNEGDDVSA
ncbi:dentin sialophosphoprotein-like [Ptychodera flava]|uniref:dentin sialophosphoprotein-like n=1 Tax=Ptychodera flava TaxID=63121 RepID=UPI00396AA8E1